MGFNSFFSSSVGRGYKNDAPNGAVNRVIGINEQFKIA
jgi:hypothetical protein